MELFVVRHGQAVARAASDAERALDTVGIAQVEVVAASLAATGIVVAEVWSSPYLRTRQTATALAAAVGCEVAVRDELMPDEPPQVIAEAIAQWVEPRSGALILVSHMPLVARLIGWLIAATTDPSAEVALQTAALARLIGEPPLPGCFRLQSARAPGTW